MDQHDEIKVLRDIIKNKEQEITLLITELKQTREQLKELQQQVESGKIVSLWSL